MVHTGKVERLSQTRLSNLDGIISQAGRKDSSKDKFRQKAARVAGGEVGTYFALNIINGAGRATHRSLSRQPLD